MNLFQIGNYNGKFMRPNSFLPIAGTIANTAFNRVLVQAKISAQGQKMLQGMSIAVSNKLGTDATVRAGKGLSPNVLTATYSATAVDGFLVDSANCVVLQGDDFPQYLDNQIVRVALIGSGAELYLPCDNSVSGSTDLLYFDPATQLLKKAATVPTGGVALNAVIMSQVIEGIKGKVDNDRVTTESCFVVKVKI